MFIANSISTNYGGGAAIVSSRGDIAIRRTLFRNNTAYTGGGGCAAITGNSGLVCQGNVTLTDNVFYSNSSTFYGGGCLVWTSKSCDIAIINNTFRPNTAGSSGGGVELWLEDAATTANIYNNIIRSNTAPTGSDINIDDDLAGTGTGAEVNLFHNDFHGYHIKDGDHTSSGHNIDADPSLASDFHLKTGSPCIDTGDNSAPSIPPMDFEWDQRILDGGTGLGTIVDMGADEYFFVAPTVTPTPTWAAPWPPGTTPTPTPTLTPTPNYINLSLSPGSISPGGLITLFYSCDFGMLDYRNRNFDVYLAAVRSPYILDSGSTVADVLAGGEIYIFNQNMNGAYRYTTQAIRPAFSQVTIPPVPTAGVLLLNAPAVSGFSGDWVFAIALFYSHEGPIRTDLPVENSNLFTLL